LLKGATHGADGTNRVVQLASVSELTYRTFPQIHSN